MGSTNSRHSLYRPRTFAKLLYLWLVYLAKNLLRGKRFIALTPAFSRRQILLDRAQHTLFHISIRDGVDWTQLEHIYLCQEYDLQRTGRAPAILRYHEEIKRSGSKPLIIDCGANIGLASRYFWQTFSGSRIVSIEPDRRNMALARINNPGGDIFFVEAAISCEAGTGCLIDMGSNNAFRVRKEASGELQFVTVESILQLNRGCRPFMIKIDIEGFEKDLFSAATDWIDSFPVIIIELHDWMLPGNRTAQGFLREISRRDRDFMHYDGYVVSISNSMV